MKKLFENFRQFEEGDDAFKQKKADDLVDWAEDLARRGGAIELTRWPNGAIAIEGTGGMRGSFVVEDDGTIFFNDNEMPIEQAKKGIEMMANKQ